MARAERPGRKPVPRALLLLALLSVGTLAACHTLPADFFNLGRSSRTIRIEVRNDNFLDATVYAMGDGMTFRLGQVTGKSGGTFILDPRKVSVNRGLRLLVELLGSSEAYISDTVLPDAGATVYLQIGATLRQSFISMR